MKRCCKCKMPKAETEFNKNRSMRDGLSPACRKCRKEEHSNYYQNNREKVLARTKKWWDAHPEAATVKGRKYYQNNPEKVRLKIKKFHAENPAYRRTAALKRNYGITPKDFARMEAEQAGVCAVCKQVPEGKGFYVDHDHKTGRVRGLLCFTCNMALGLLKDSAVFARSAAEYLEKHL